MHSAATGLDVLIDDEAESTKAFHHDLRVLAVEHSRERGRTVTQRCENHRAIGDALRPGRTKCADDRYRDRLDFDQGHRPAVAPSFRRRSDGCKVQ